MGRKPETNKRIQELRKSGQLIQIISNWKWEYSWFDGGWCHNCPVAGCKGMSSSCGCCHTDYMFSENKPCESWWDSQNSEEGNNIEKKFFKCYPLISDILEAVRLTNTTASNWTIDFKNLLDVLIYFGIPFTVTHLEDGCWTLDILPNSEEFIQRAIEYRKNYTFPPGINPETYEDLQNKRLTS